MLNLVIVTVSTTEREDISKKPFSGRGAEIQVAENRHLYN